MNESKVGGWNNEIVKERRKLFLLKVTAEAHSCILKLTDAKTSPPRKKVVPPKSVQVVPRSQKKRKESKFVVPKAV